MIVVDIECSGGDFVKNGIFQIGALDTDNPNNYFFETCRIDDEDAVEQEAMTITGTDENMLRDKSLQTQKEMLEKFIKWMDVVQTKNFVCQNPQFDHAFIRCKLSKYDLLNTIPWQAFDLHSVASLKFLQVRGSLLIKENASNMGLSNIIRFCGMEDKRMSHNALEDTKLTAECFGRILYGKKLLKEYQEYEIPEYLK